MAFGDAADDAPRHADFELQCGNAAHGVQYAAGAQRHDAEGEAFEDVGVAGGDEEAKAFAPELPDELRVSLARGAVPCGQGVVDAKHAWCVCARGVERGGEGTEWVDVAAGEHVLGALAHHSARVGAEQPRGAEEERALPCPGAAGDADALAGRHGERNARECRDRGVAAGNTGAVPPRDIGEFEERGTHARMMCAPGPRSVIARLRARAFYFGPSSAFFFARRCAVFAATPVFITGGGTGATPAAFGSS